MQIVIKGKEYGFHWGFGAILMASEIFDKDADTLFGLSLLYANDDNGDIDVTKPTFVSHEVAFGAVLNWCHMNDIDVDFTYYQFINTYNDLGEDDIKAIAKSYYKSKYNGRLVEDIFKEIQAKYDAAVKETETPSKKKPATSKRKSATA